MCRILAFAFKVVFGSQVVWKLALVVRIDEPEAAAPRLACFTDAPGDGAGAVRAARTTTTARRTLARC